MLNGIETEYVPPSMVLYDIPYPASTIANRIYSI